MGTQALLPNIKANEGKCRICITTAKFGENPYTGIPFMGSYIATKCALKSVYKTLQMELQGVAQVGLLNMGITETPLMLGFCENEEFPLADVFKPRMRKFGGDDAHTAKGAGEWIVTILDESKVSDAAFATEHCIDNPKTQYGVKVPLTSEGKLEV